jgi:hypothetical protein
MQSYTKNKYDFEKPDDKTDEKIDVKTEVIVSVYGDYHYLDYSNWLPSYDVLQDKLVSLSKVLNHEDDQASKAIYIIKPL